LEENCTFKFLIPAIKPSTSREKTLIVIGPQLPLSWWWLSKPIFA
jgi:hypothetical protein